MKTIKKVPIKTEFVKYIPEELKEETLYVSEEYNIVVHSCLCGCGERTVTPLDDEYGWVLTKHNNGNITLSPSIGNYSFECKSHYIITNNVANFV
jgi:hypothetical protein